jgi:hypothetical protein
MINLYRMVFNSMVFELLDRYKENKMDKSEAMTLLNTLADYVRDNESTNNKKNNGDNKKRSDESV